MTFDNSRRRNAASWTRRPLWLILSLPMGLITVLALGGSYFARGWWQDVLLSLGFLALGVLLTVLYVNWAVKHHEDQRWAQPRAIAAIRIRRAASNFVGDVAGVLRLDPGDSRFFVPAWYQRVDPLDWNRERYNNPKWIAFVRQEVIPATPQLEHVRDPGDIDWLIKSLELYRERIRENLSLLQGYLNPSQVEHLSAILDRISVQLHWLNVRRKGNPDYFGPQLTELVERSLALIEESNRNPDAYLPTIAELSKGEPARVEYVRQ